MMNKFRRSLKRLLDKLPGQKKYGFYAYVPIVFLGGAALEIFMNEFRVGDVSFYKTLKRRLVQDAAKDSFERELQFRKLLVESVEKETEPQTAK